MKNTARLLIIVFFIQSVFIQNAFALFDTSYWGVRALGMGGAFTAVADDSSAPIYNIAGAASLEKPEITFMSARLFAGIEGFDFSTDYLGGIYPFGEKYGNVSAGWAFLGDAGLRREDSISVGYARKLDDIIKMIYEDIDWLNVMAGINFRYLRHETKSVGSYGDLSNSAFGLDVGLLLRFKYGISAGYSGRFINGAEIGYRMKDNIKPTNVIGLSYYNEELPFLKVPQFTVALDYEMRGGENLLIAGIESKILDGKLALRAGGYESQINFGFGYLFSFGESKLIIDYAFGLPIGGIQESAGSHFVSLSFRFP
ncbi:MAG: hypothetical protein LBQ47_06855 [Endomicrobium sp.]|jgi:hypothetical protein|nr:hypothetical protein [Endomicrobium sp.]